MRDFIFSVGTRSRQNHNSEFNLRAYSSPVVRILPVQFFGFSRAKHRVPHFPPKQRTFRIKLPKKESLLLCGASILTASDDDRRTDMYPDLNKHTNCVFASF
jgi:hypothetical protein